MIKSIVTPVSSEELSGLRREKLSILLRCKDTLVENMRLGNENMHLRSEIDRHKVVIEFLIKRLTKCGCHKEETHGK